MMELAASRGYDATSIKSVCALAGVSRRTFYDVFGTSRRAPKEACFLAACDFVVARAVQRVKLAYRCERDPERRLYRAFEQFAYEVANEPGTARAMLVDAPGAGPAALARLERARHVFERMISAGTADASSGATLPHTVAKGIVGGLERVARVQMAALTSSLQRLMSSADGLPAMTPAAARCWPGSQELKLAAGGQVREASARTRACAFSVPRRRSRRRRATLISVRPGSPGSPR
jgi:AcrR family transcriptional regulator